MNDTTVVFAIGEKQLMHACNMYRGQAASTSFWINQWNKNKDGSAAKNALFSLGKSSGMFSLLEQAFPTPGSVPQELQDMNAAFSIKFDEIMSVFFVPYKEPT